MKAKSLVTVIAVILLCGGASAQGYSIRITYNSNLRAAASLSARIVETVPSGTTLHVVGNNNRWLRINRNGSEVWIADWVGYTRVENSQQTNTQTSQIDNCCFVDRQCATDEEWTSGYWAFQNKQCAAPAQSRQQPASQPASNLSSSADNCCFLDWQCNTDAEWQNGFYAYQNDQCDHPGIAIQGSARFTSMMKRVFNMLRAGARQWYDYVINSGLRRIQMNPPGHTGFDPNDFHYGQGYDESFVQDEFYHIAIAGILTHESCHAHQERSGILFSRPHWQNEKECVQAQLAVHEALDPICRECSWYRDIIANIENPEYWWW